MSKKIKAILQNALLHITAFFVGSIFSHVRMFGFVSEKDIIRLATGALVYGIFFSVAYTLGYSRAQKDIYLINQEN